MKQTKYLVVGILLFAMPLCGLAATSTIISTWNGGSAGTYSWLTAGNWDNGVPDNGTNLYQAVIGDSTGNRVITTGTDITVSRILISQSTATSGAGTTLQLGGNFDVNGNSNSGGILSPSSFTNSTGDASKLVIDLAGYNFTVESTVTFSTLFKSSNFTIESPGNAGGIYAAVRIFSTTNLNVDVDDNVTVELTQSAENDNLTGYSFSAASTLWLSGTGTFTNFQANLAVGNFVVGDSGAAARTIATLTTSLTTQSSVTLNTYQGAVGGDASLLALNGKNLIVGGSFTDNGSNGDNYGSGVIVFSGDSAGQQQVSISRHSLINDFQVGQNSTTKGNIALNTNLITSGSFHILAGSTLNTQTSMLEAGTVTVDNGANIALTFGQNSGIINSTGTLLLGSFNLALTYDGSGWINGSDLVLFSYAGDPSGVTPVLASFSGSGFTYDQLVNDTALKEVYLSDVIVAVPEPRIAALFILGSGLFLITARRRIRCL